jgi:predicted NUDIX family NTP pyrophosphohydrolase
VLGSVEGPSRAPVFGNVSPRRLVNIGVVSDREAGVAVVVWRRSPEGEVLLLHRSLFGAEYDQDWAWMTPGGGRRAGEHPQDAAERELFEDRPRIEMRRRPLARLLALNGGKAR